MLIARNPVSVVLSSLGSALSSFLSSRDSVFHCAARRRSRDDPPDPRFFRHGSNRDRTSVTDVNLSFCASVGTTKIDRDTATSPTSPSIPVPTFPIRATAHFLTKPRCSTNLPTISSISLVHVEYTIYRSIQSTNTRVSKLTRSRLKSF